LDVASAINIALEDVMKSLVAAIVSLLLVEPAAGHAAEKAADFAKTVAISDMFEVEAGKLAQDKGTDAQKNFGAMMVKDHTKTSTELKALVSSGKVKVELPNSLDKAHQAKLDNLKKASGKDFAAAYKKSQVDAHNDAIKLFEGYAKNGDVPELKDWAGKTLPALKHHGEMANKL
jgi:putative membrane protein